jgi:hypothetical protein
MPESESPVPSVGRLRLLYVDVSGNAAHERSSTVSLDVKKGVKDWAKLSGSEAVARFAAGYTMPLIPR